MPLKQKLKIRATMLNSKKSTFRKWHLKQSPIVRSPKSSFMAKKLDGAVNLQNVHFSTKDGAS